MAGEQFVLATASYYYYYYIYPVSLFSALLISHIVLCRSHEEGNTVAGQRHRVSYPAIWYLQLLLSLSLVRVIL